MNRVHEKPPFLVMSGITKTFPGVKALDAVNLELHRGEVLGLLGENGAGKSTLIKILAGDYQCDQGTISLEGRSCSFLTPQDAQKEGIRVIYQELISMESLSVTENIFVNDLPTKGLLKRVDWDTAHKMARDVLARMGIAIDPTSRVSDLSVHEKQIIEIAKAIHRKAEILVMDEPTAALGRKDTESLFEVIRTLKEQGVGIIYISHRMEEIFEITDSVTVLRDGKLIGSVKTDQTHADELVSMMVGKELASFTSRQEAIMGETLLELVDVATFGGLEGINLSVKRGEVVGLFGLLGSGRFNVIHALFGLERITAGKIFIKGEEATISRPSDALSHAIGYMPLDRKLEGLALGMSVRENITLCSIDTLGPGALIDTEYESAQVQTWVDQVRIKTSSAETLVGTLSGGNQQKIVLAKMLEKASEILLMIEPTRGIDVGAKAEIYQMIEELCKKGCAVLVASSDIPEMVAICDRIEVLKHGKITTTMNRGEFSQQRLLASAAGGTI